ncbi:ATP synthase F1 subunit gamma [Candidatus Poribacteria bacterium]|nr:ATP synthase F1 subunit gamma [Candidatus Poribacteria bacterium]
MHRMATLRQIRRRIRGIQNIRRITGAMRMVAQARLRRAQEQTLDARPYFEELSRLTDELVSGVADYSHPLLDHHDGDGSVLLVVTGDRGMCGAFNANVIRRAVQYVEDAPGAVKLICLGTRGATTMQRRGLDVAHAHPNFFADLTHAHARLVTHQIRALYESDDVGRVDMIYNEFKSIIQQEVKLDRMLPVTVDAGGDADARWDFLHEPSRAHVLDELLPRVLETEVWHAVLESNAAEQAARVAAMENATTNADEIIDSLILQRNRVRQAVITQEISEIVGGAEALKTS